MIEIFKEAAKQNLIKDGSLMPVAIVKSPVQNLVLGFSWKDDEEKFSVYNKLSSIVKQNKATEVIFIVEAWHRTIEEKDAEYVLQNIETEKPTCYPERMRKECITISHFDITNKKVNLTTIPFKRENGKFIFEKEATTANAQGSVPNLFW